MLTLLNGILPKDFQTFMEAKGAEFHPTTSEWEVVRYRFEDALHIIYKNKHDRPTYCGDSIQHVMDAPGGRMAMRSPAKREDEGSSPSQASKPIADVLKGWPSATDTARQPASDCSEPETRDEQASDNSPPWE